MNDSLINEQTMHEALIAHGKSQEWRNYAQRITKNPFVKEYLFKKYKGICPYCGLKLNQNFVLHHRVYDRECVTAATIRVSRPTEKRPNKTAKVPNCESCTIFHECVDEHIYPIHVTCNMRIAEEVKLRLKGDEE